ncbi:MAG TPA: DUF805 domain-containing protein [Rhizomicrobium sp.]|jgi:uncharacterized membrane protein YhaH (DUF805 family)
MSFFEAVRTCFSKFADFTGRARRSEYWYFFLFAVLLQIAARISDAIFFPATMHALRLRFTGPVTGIELLVLLLPGLAAVTRRLHDTSRSGWWIVGYFCLYIAIAAITIFAALHIGYWALSGLAFDVALIIGFWVILALPGTSGANRYGPDPLVQPKANPS